ncbi:MAG TPA: ABC transporter permease [Gaiellaceae bacterium]|nr:ABC transporter permease [Gaiellaceae bacterium]
MLRYTARRLAAAFFVAFGVTVATFLLLHLAPGDPARVVLGERASPQALAALRHQWGLDSSLGSQFTRYLDGLAHGNLGTSFINKTSTSSLIRDRIGVSAALVALATVFAVIITVPLASFAAVRKDRAADHIVRALSVAGIGFPAFWFGIVLIEVFALRVHAFPVGGWGSSTETHLRSLVLPALTAAFAIVPILVRSLRVGMIEVFNADFVATLRSKGLGERRVLAHVMRNALIPTLTLLGINVAYLIGSTVVIERVFDLNGLGSLLLTAISQRDFPVVQSVTLVLAIGVVIVNFLTDVIAAELDPRIRLE